MITSSNKKNKILARNLRKDGTKGEAMLWKNVLRARQIHGIQFNRQYRIGNYIVDFISRKLKLIIEIDGSSHLQKSRSDFTRQAYLEKLGYTLIRFEEKQVLFDLKGVAREIYYAVESLLDDNPPILTKTSGSPPLEKGDKKL